MCVGGVDQNKRISAPLKNLLGKVKSLDPEHARHHKKRGSDFFIHTFFLHLHRRELWPKNQRRCKTRSMHEAKYSGGRCATWYKWFNILSSSAGQQALQLHSHTVRVLFSIFSRKKWHQLSGISPSYFVQRRSLKKNYFLCPICVKIFFSPHEFF